jgi:D-Tyr-tRNAtyr deacylase
VRAVVQRVARAGVTVEARVTGEFDRGLVGFRGAGGGDAAAVLRCMGG